MRFGSIGLALALACAALAGCSDEAREPLAAGGSGGAGGEGGSGGSGGGGMPTCGDAVREGAEACDDGVRNSDTVPNACRTDCTLAGCGDGVRDREEACDAGDANSDEAADACRTDCSAATCGDGVKDTGEACDEGDANSDTEDGACRTTCKLATCGDGAVDTPEECDDGPAGSARCTPTCLRINCGDGVRDSGEACDDGGANSDVQPDACRSDCSAPACGDRVIDSGEVCDDGNGAAGDGCFGCAVEAGWACDASGCHLMRCGDGIVDPANGETCDDGNTQLADGCSAVCGIETGWSCRVPGDPCTRWTCGNGFVEGAESCDDGNRDGGDGCSAACVIEVPPPGGTRLLQGTLRETDRTWTVMADDCDAFLPVGARAHVYDIVNTSDWAQELNIAVDFPDAGWVHAYVSPLTGNGGREGCIRGADGLDGQPTRSLLQALRIEAHQQLVIVVSGARAGMPYGYEMILHTLQPTCGDGWLTGGEVCDDGNTAAGDGCNAACNAIEPGWGCPMFGACEELPPPGFVINEVDYDNIGSPDTEEFIEVYNGSGVPIDLMNYALYLVEGNSSDGVDYGYFYFNSNVPTLAPGEYMVLGSQDLVVAPGAHFTLLFNNSFTDNLEAGRAGVALVNTSTLTVIDALSYGGGINGVLLSLFPPHRRTSLVEGSLTTIEDSDIAKGSLCRRPNGIDTDDASFDWAFCETPTPGAANSLN